MKVHNMQLFFKEIFRVQRIISILSVTAALLFFNINDVYARDKFSGAFSYMKVASKECPQGWVRSSAPGGCSPGFFTLKLAGIRATDGCPEGWVRSSAPGGCSPGFFTIQMNGARDSRRSCPDGWVRSSAPGGCSPEYLTLKQAGLQATDSCPEGWVRSSAPGGCSPGNFTLEPGFDGIDQARYHCAFGNACDVMIEAVLALGGTCSSKGRDTSCEIPPLIEE